MTDLDTERLCLRNSKSSDLDAPVTYRNDINCTRYQRGSSVSEVAWPP